MENEIISKKMINFLKESDFLKEPLFDVIDAYFSTFTSLHLALMEFVMNYNKHNEIYSDVLERDNVFPVRVDTVKKRIAIEISDKQGATNIIQHYIKDQYNTLKTSLIEWGIDYHRYKSFYFPLRKSYTENSIQATLFFTCTGFWGTNANPKEPTIGDFYDETIHELETGYNAIMTLFAVAPTTKSMTTKTPQQITIPDNILKWLKETKCANGETYIENTTVNPLKWLQNKQLARELLSHDKIKGSLKMAAVEQQTPSLFVDKNNHPLTLAKNKKIPSTDSDNLSNYLVAP